MAQLIIAAAGAAIGGAIAPGVVALGMTGAGIGWTVGSLIGSMFAPTQKGYGPRLGDLRVSGSSYGAVAPWVAGTPRIAGQVIWASTKREIAHTEEQGGKGGGGSEYTTYTYEVDLLILLSENAYVGVSRVWLNGALVWNKSSTSDSATKAASDAYSGWSSITHYDGAASQLPDPIYEAAVTTALAPAYRGRSSVMIEALQLGGGGQIPNLTFELDEAWDGDHLAGDGLTRLQTSFAGGSSNDLSPYAIGPGVIQGAASVSDGLLTVPLTAGVAGWLRWTDSGLSKPAATAMTYEYFVQLVEVTVNPVNGAPDIATLFNIDGLSDGGGYSGTHHMGYNGYDAGKNPLVAYMGGGQYLGTPSPQFDVFSAGWMHIAYVYTAAGSGVLSLYVNGQRIVEKIGAGAHLSGDSILTLGGYIATADVTVQFKGVRVRRAAMYSGASFTPPAGPEAWGAP